MKEKKYLKHKVIHTRGKKRRRNELVILPEDYHSARKYKLEYYQSVKVNLPKKRP